MTTSHDDKNCLVTAVSEELEVGKRVVDRGGYRIVKSVETREVPVDQLLSSDEVAIERLPKNQVVSSEQPPSIRHEGDTTIIPVLEEVLVLERRLVLKEEIHIVRRRSQRHEKLNVELSSEQVKIERIEPSSESHKTL